MVNITINGIVVEIEDGATILEAARMIGIKIPTLCHFELDCFDIENRTGSCRVCVVEVDGRRNLAPSCCTPVMDGMVVTTNSIRAINARRTVVDLILSDHPKDCLTCAQNGNCELQDLAADLKLTNVEYEGEISTYPIDISNKSIRRDLSKCIMCRRCETACNEMQTVGILSAVGRGFEAVVAPTLGKPLSETKCVFCGQCVAACPVGALTGVIQVPDVWKVLNDPTKTVIVQTAPAVRVALGEGFGMEPGTISTGKMTT
ncbi:MAG: (2Fe-2S)-binding protein, partial [Lentisphaeria bacterium]|nr:(2Fe-2S)-binding protein [Lentisphaeria bacterium]